jgi:hypothetical protein
VERRRHAPAEAPALEDERIELQREIWEEGQKNQAKSIENAQEIAKEERKLAGDRLALLKDAEDKIYALDLGLENMDKSARTFVDRMILFLEEERRLAREARALASTPGAHHDSGGGGAGQDDDTQGGPTLTQAYGGPVGTPTDTLASDAVLSILHKGEYVVPKGGMLVSKGSEADQELVRLTRELVNLIREGNGRFELIIQNPQIAVGEGADLYQASLVT